MARPLRTGHPLNVLSHHRLTCPSRLASVRSGTSVLLLALLLGASKHGSGGRRCPLRNTSLICTYESHRESYGPVVPHPFRIMRSPEASCVHAHATWAVTPGHWTSRLACSAGVPQSSASVLSR